MISFHVNICFPNSTWINMSFPMRKFDHAALQTISKHAYICSAAKKRHAAQMEAERKPFIPSHCSIECDGKSKAPVVTTCNIKSDVLINFIAGGKQNTRTQRGIKKIYLERIFIIISPSSKYAQITNARVMEWSGTNAIFLQDCGKLGKKVLP